MQIFVAFAVIVQALATPAIQDPTRLRTRTPYFPNIGHPHAGPVQAIPQFYPTASLKVAGNHAHSDKIFREIPQFYPVASLTGNPSNFENNLRTITEFDPIASLAEAGNPSKYDGGLEKVQSSNYFPYANVYSNLPALNFVSSSLPSAVPGAAPITYSAGSIVPFLSAFANGYPNSFRAVNFPQSNFLEENELLKAYGNKNVFIPKNKASEYESQFDFTSQYSTPFHALGANTIDRFGYENEAIPLKNHFYDDDQDVDDDDEVDDYDEDDSSSIHHQRNLAFAKTQPFSFGQNLFTHGRQSLNSPASQLPGSTQYFIPQEQLFSSHGVHKSIPLAHGKVPASHIGSHTGLIAKPYAGVHPAAVPGTHRHL
ncbi:uncharacterized protein LOC108676201 [Hyalella azteca]|uniref:Uncharacterized protein LOC108676201 n=1 Tax=Hyalella azteca TaxID=294128 RepID=A0A8B7P3W6_HYAAZ|nr:uncharacterized protein LOC108676201 [Hyalella azteca]